VSSLGGVHQVVLEEVQRPAGRHVEPAEDVEQRRFAAAGRPEQHHQLSVEEREIHARERAHHDLAHHVGLGQALRDEDRSRRVVHALGLA
jgi:hypothetical protein